MARYDPAKIKELAKQLAEYATDRAPAPEPRIAPKAVVPDDFPAEIPCTTEREWLCDQVRWLTQIYGLHAFVKQEIRGYAGLEWLPDDELRQLYKRIGRAIECIRDGTSFEDAGLITYDMEP